MTGRDIFIFMIVLLVTGVVLFAEFFAGNLIITKFEETPVVNASLQAVAAMEGSRTAINKLDYLFFGVMLGSVLFMWVSACFPVTIGVRW